MKNTRRLFSKAASASAASLQRLRPFELERNSLWWTPGVEQLTASDVEPMAMKELLELEPGSLQALQDLSLGYPDSQGSPALRQAVAEMYDCSVSPENVTIVAPAEGILLGILALCSSGDTVVASTPAYQSLTEIAKSIGCEVVPWHARASGGGGGGGGGGGNGGGVSGEAAGYTFSVDELKSVVKEKRPSLLVVNFPHNPTGYIPSPQEWEEIGELCEEYGVRLFGDEMYRGMELQGCTTLSSAVDLVPSRGVSLSGLSKWGAAPGLRAGWLVTGDPDVTARINTLKDYTVRRFSYCRTLVLSFSLSFSLPPSLSLPSLSLPSLSLPSLSLPSLPHPHPYTPNSPDNLSQRRNRVCSNHRGQAP